VLAVRVEKLVLGDGPVIWIMLTTLAAPAFGRLAVVKVPVPGDPAVKVMPTLVAATVFVPDTVYLTV
jgi:hypothetical protein